MFNVFGKNYGICKYAGPQQHRKFMHLVVLTKRYIVRQYLWLNTIFVRICVACCDL